MASGLSRFRRAILGSVENAPAPGIWLVQFAQMGGADHPTYFTDEERAKRHAERRLERFVHVMRRLGEMGAYLRDEERVKQAAATAVAAGEIERELEAGNVWKAYYVLKDFQAYANNTFRDMMFPIEMQMGTMRVIPDPEPESY